MISRKQKYSSAQVTVSLGLPCKDPKIYNKIEVANAMIKERLFRVPGISLCDNSNLSYRGRPARGMLEEDRVHIFRQGVFAMNNNMRACTISAVNQNQGPFSRGEVIMLDLVDEGRPVIMWVSAMIVLGDK